jgi:hypothetical protein
MDGSGNADLLPAFLNSYNFTQALHLDRACRISVFQHDGELYGLSGGKGTVRLEEYPGAAEVAGYAFAALKFDRQFALVTRRSAFFRRFHCYLYLFLTAVNHHECGKTIYRGDILF